MSSLCPRACCICPDAIGIRFDDDDNICESSEETLRQCVCVQLYAIEESGGGESDGVDERVRVAQRGRSQGHYVQRRCSNGQGSDCGVGVGVGVNGKPCNPNLCSLHLRLRKPARDWQAERRRRLWRQRWANCIHRRRRWWRSGFPMRACRSLAMMICYRHTIAAL